MISAFWTALRFAVLVFLLSGVVYPLSVTALAQWLFPHQANGSIIVNAQGRAIGSELIGQAFSAPEYFHPRPAANAYDGANSGGSNLGATSQKLIDRVQQDAGGYRALNPTVSRIPLDALTTSGSSLDPHISLANALAQIPRIANVRSQSEASLQVLVRTYAQRPLLSDATYVSVLQLNLALDSVLR